MRFLSFYSDMAGSAPATSKECDYLLKGMLPPS